MLLSNLHTHTVYSDGKNTPEEYVLAALEKGFVSLGFSEHAPAPYDACQIAPEKMPEYLAELGRLREKYAGRIELYAGLETDYYSPLCDWGLDYVIGSVHYLKTPDGRCLSVDYLHESMAELIGIYGGVQGMVGEYYRLVGDVVLNQKPDILGHMDLITKLNGGNRYFDPSCGWYRELAAGAAEAAARGGVIVEVNTGAIFRGYTEIPYPDSFILSRLYELGVPVTVSSDAHAAVGLDCAFGLAEEVLRKAGYRSVMRLEGGSFREAAL